MRLLYVALTRAVHAVHVYWIDRDKPLDDDYLAWDVAALDPLIAQVQRQLGLDEGEASLASTARQLAGVSFASAIGAAT